YRARHECPCAVCSSPLSVYYRLSRSYTELGAARQGYDGVVDAEGEPLPHAGHGAGHLAEHGVVESRPGDLQRAAEVLGARAERRILARHVSLLSSASRTRSGAAASSARAGTSRALWTERASSATASAACSASSSWSSSTWSTADSPSTRSTTWAHSSLPSAAPSRSVASPLSPNAFRA